MEKISGTTVHYHPGHICSVIKNIFILEGQMPNSGQLGSRSRLMVKDTTFFYLFPHWKSNNFDLMFAATWEVCYTH
jgi:hypothetical protein